MLEKLKAEVCRANLDLVAKGLVIETWGNASGVDRARGIMVIKPSGVPYDGTKHMVAVSLANGKVRERKLKPNSDTDTHLALYRAFRKSVVLSTPIACTPPPGPRLAGRFPLTARLRQTIGMGTFRAPG